MESHGVDGEIQLAKSTHDKLIEKFIIKPRGLIEVKGKGQMETFFLVSPR